MERWSAEAATAGGATGGVARTGGYLKQETDAYLVTSEGQKKSAVPTGENDLRPNEYFVDDDKLLKAGGGYAGNLPAGTPRIPPDNNAIGWAAGAGWSAAGLPKSTQVIQWPEWAGVLQQRQDTLQAIFPYSDNPIYGL